MLIFANLDDAGKRTLQSEEEEMRSTGSQEDGADEDVILRLYFC